MTGSAPASTQVDAEERRGRSFERSMFGALLGVALIPTAVVVLAGAFALSDTLQRSGSAGPWTEVSASGEALADEVIRGWPDGQAVPASVQSAIDTHRTTLESSVGMSRLYAAVSARVLDRLPLFVGVLAVFIALLAWMASRRLARRFARPVRELVDWTHRIARDEPLPAVASAGGGGSQGILELDALGDALRSMYVEVTHARARAVETARLSMWTAAARRVAHEIKNPLTPMKLATRQLRDAVAGDTGQKSADLLLEEIDRLDDLARTFVQVGSPPEGPGAPVNLVDLASTVVEPFKDGRVPVTLEVEGRPALVLGHLAALRGAIRNLVLNAVESCESQSGEDDTIPGVTVRISEARGPDGTLGVSIAVDDEGTGLPEGLESTVWNLDVTTKRRGSGVGLPIVRQTVLAHDGRVEAANRPEGGARFVLWIPANVADSPWS